MFGLVGVTVGELFEFNRGLGYMIEHGAETYQTTILYAVVFLLAMRAFFLMSFTSSLKPDFNNGTRGTEAQATANLEKLN